MSRCATGDWHDADSWRRAPVSPRQMNTVAHYLIWRPRTSTRQLVSYAEHQAATKASAHGTWLVLVRAKPVATAHSDTGTDSERALTPRMPIILTLGPDKTTQHKAMQALARPSLYPQAFAHLRVGTYRAKCTRHYVCRSATRCTFALALRVLELRTTVRM